MPSQASPDCSLLSAASPFASHHPAMLLAAENSIASPLGLLERLAHFTAQMVTLCPHSVGFFSIVWTVVDGLASNALSLDCCKAVASNYRLGDSINRCSSHDNGEDTGLEYLSTEAQACFHSAISLFASMLVSMHHRLTELVVGSSVAKTLEGAGCHDFSHLSPDLLLSRGVQKLTEELESASTLLTNALLWRPHETACSARVPIRIGGLLPHVQTHLGGRLNCWSFGLTLAFTAACLPEWPTLSAGVRLALTLLPLTAPSSDATAKANQPCLSAQSQLTQLLTFQQVRKVDTNNLGDINADSTNPYLFKVRNTILILKGGGIEAVLA
ncbi:unnamed protein product [Protopolystoma xenopodis]|uniref:Uncharacterized protein n=1 Tax=Protopolystoma xenopodis TaxID=117903 RepID=A0A3S5A912_9PLAT|nr:unnamed protein product [Protopolystoma xenopodis]